MLVYVISELKYMVGNKTQSRDDEAKSDVTEPDGRHLLHHLENLSFSLGFLTLYTNTLNRPHRHLNKWYSDMQDLQKETN